MPPHLLHFDATRARFEQAALDFRTALDDVCGTDSRARQHAELIFEEVVSNVIRHGGAHALDVSVAAEPHRKAVILTFEDDGCAFNPLEAPTPPVPATIEDAPLGGLGLLLVRKASLRLQYERTSDGRNRLTVAVAST